LRADHHCSSVAERQFDTAIPANIVGSFALAPPAYAPAAVYQDWAVGAAPKVLNLRERDLSRRQGDVADLDRILQNATHKLQCVKEQRESDAAPRPDEPHRPVGYGIGAKGLAQDDLLDKAVPGKNGDAIDEQSDPPLA
jgi:hypothetical protein